MATTTIRSSSVGVPASTTRNGGRLLQQGQCGSFQQLNSTYNSENAIPPYTGIMFEMFSKVNMEILTLELDIRFENGVDDLFIEVFTKEGAFSAFVNDESAWEKVAETTMVAAPEGVGAIIPVDDFATVVMPKRTKRSFYLTMKGPYIDFTAYALQKTGEIYIKGGDFDILVGSGLTEYKFPEKIDRILDPQFAGVVHYNLVSDNCDGLTSEATIEYRFLFSQDMEPTFFEALNGAFGEFMEKSLANNPTLQIWVTEFGLAQGGVETTSIPFSGQCPPAWPVCPTTYLATKLSLQHMDGLESGLVKFEFLKSTEAAIGTANSAGQGTQALYLGEKSVSVEFTFTLAGVPSDVMDEVQQEYFSDVCRSFIDSAARERYTSVLAVVIKEQTPQRYLRVGGRMMNTEGSISMSGSIAGAIPAAFEPNHFKETLDIAFAGGSEGLISALRLGGLRPSKITGNDRIAFFLGATSITPVFKEVVRPIAPDTGGGSDLSNASIAMIEGAAFFVFLVAVAAGVHFYRKSQNDKLKAEERRQKRRNEKRRKHEKTDSDDTVSLLSKADRGKNKSDATGAKPQLKRSTSDNIKTGAKPPAPGPKKPPLKRTQSTPALVQKGATPQKKPGSVVATRPLAAGVKRPGLARSQSVSALGNRPAANGTVKRPMVKAALKPNPPAGTKGSVAPRPVLRKSLSVSAIGTNGNKRTVGPTAVTTKSAAVVAKVIKVAAKPNGTTGRPAIQRSLSVSAMGTKPKTTVQNGKIAPKPGGKPAAAMKARPVMQRSLSVSALGNKAKVTANGPNIAKPASATKPSAAPTKVLGLPGKAPNSRPVLQRSLSVSAIKAKPVVGQTKPATGGGLANTAKVSPAVAKARPVIKRSLSVSVVTANGKIPNTKPPGVAVPAGGKPAARPALQRSLSVSAMSAKAKAPGAAPKPTAESVTTNPAKAAPTTAKAAATPGARPALQRSMSVSAMGGKVASTVVPPKIAVNPTVPAPAAAKTTPKTGPTVAARPSMQRSLSVSAMNAKPSTIAGPPKSMNPKPAATPLAPKPSPKTGSTTAARPSVQRSLSVSAVNTKPSTTAGEPKTINPKPAPTSVVAKPPPKMGAARPVLQRSMSVSVMGAKTTSPLTGPRPPGAAPDRNVPKPAEVAKPIVAGAKPPGQRPGLQRSLSVSAVGSRVTKPTGAAATPTPTKAPVVPAVPPAKTTPTTAGRPVLKKSMSVSVIGGPKPVAKNPVGPAGQPKVAAVAPKKPVAGKPVAAGRPMMVRSQSVSVIKS